MNTLTDNVTALPHALAVEKSTLSALLTSPELFDEPPGLTAEHFHIPAHRVVFENAKRLYATGQPIELVSFVQMLLDRGELDRTGGPSEIAHIFSHALPGYFKNHTQILREKLARRMTIAAADEMRRVAYESDDYQEILAATSTPISRIHDTLTDTRPERSTTAALIAFAGRFEALCMGRADPMGIQVSLAEINHRFRGLHPNQTVVISALPGCGKTTLAAQLAIDSALAGHNTLICSLEMSEEIMIQRMVAYVSRLPGKAITAPIQYAREMFDIAAPPKPMLEKIKTAMVEIKAAPFKMEDLTNANVHQIGACIRRAHRKNPLKVVVVDYAQRISAVAETSKQSREQQLSHASNYLSDLARELGFCLLLASQLNKEGAAKHAEAINEAADLHLQISQDCSGVNGLKVVKDRHNGEGGELLPIILDGPSLKFITRPLST